MERRIVLQNNSRGALSDNTEVNYRGVARYSVFDIDIVKNTISGLPSRARHGKTSLQRW